MKPTKLNDTRDDGLDRPADDVDATVDEPISKRTDLWTSIQTDGHPAVGASEFDRFEPVEQTPTPRLASAQGGRRSASDVLRDVLVPVHGMKAAAVVSANDGKVIEAVGVVRGMELGFGAAACAELVDSRTQPEGLSLKPGAQEVVLSRDDSVHFIRPLEGRADAFLYVVVDVDRVDYRATIARVREAARSIDPAI